MKDTLFAFLQAFDDDSLPDGAWQAMIEDGVTAWNEAEKANLDPFENFLEYVAETEDRQKL